MLLALCDLDVLQNVFVIQVVVSEASRWSLGEGQCAQMRVHLLHILTFWRADDPSPGPWIRC